MRDETFDDALAALTHEVRVSILRELAKPTNRSPLSNSGPASA
ncbi:MAG: hypothetical protein ABEH58_05985 [Haloplanus sp.]